MGGTASFITVPETSPKQADPGQKVQPDMLGYPSAYFQDTQWITSQQPETICAES